MYRAVQGESSLRTLSRRGPTMHALLETVIYEAVPGVGPVAPPGADKVALIISWLLALAGLACVAGVIISGVKIALAGHGRGGGGEHGMALVMSLLGAVVCAVAFGLVTLMGL